MRTSPSSSTSRILARPGSFLACTMLAAVLADLTPAASPALADGIPDPCDAYARSYADSYLGSGDPNGDIVSGAMEGAVAGGAWRGPSGARRGATAGGAAAVMDNLASYPGGWQALYDMGYQICQTNLANSSAGSRQDRCQSRASVDSGPSRHTLSSRSSSLSASSCR